MNEKLNKILSSAGFKDLSIKSLEKLHGDASYRIYYRATLSNGKTLIVMQMPDGKQSASEEITNYSGKIDEPPFLNVQKYLKSVGVLVPEIVAYSPEDKVIVLEDLGDELLAKKLEHSNSADRIRTYERAIDLLCDVQEKIERDEKHACIAFKRSFDSTLLDWEFDHFLEYCVEERLCRELTGKEKNKFEEYSRAVTKDIEAIRYGFTHRDFQSRNILEKNGKLCLIDFQDALMGPYIYDLVSLLRDSYIQLSPKEVETLVKYYAEKRKFDIEKVMKEFHLVTVQRKMKDSGRFVYIDRVKKNPNYLKFIAPSLSYVKNALTNLPEHKKLYDFLSDILPEWAS